MSNIITDIQLSGVTYTLSAETGGGGITSGEVQTMIDQSISGKVNVSDNEVSGLTIKNDIITTNSYKYSYGDITDFWIEMNSDTTGSTTLYPYYITSGGSGWWTVAYSYSGRESGITDVTNTSGNFTYELVDGKLHIMFNEGYSFYYFYNPNEWAFHYYYYTTYQGGQSADVIEGSVNDALNDLNGKIITNALTSATASYEDRRIYVNGYSNVGGSSSSVFLNDNKTLKYVTNEGLHVSFSASTPTLEYFNYGSDVHWTCPSYPSYDSSYDSLIISFNSGYTGSTTSYDLTVYAINSGGTRQSDTYTYDTSNYTLTFKSGSNITDFVMDGYNAVFTIKEGNSGLKMNCVAQYSGQIIGVDAVDKSPYSIIGVSTPTYDYNGQDIIDDIYSKIASGGGITSGEVQSMIDSSISGKVDTSSVVTSVTSASTDSEIPTAKAVYDALGSASGGITSGEVQTMIDESISGKTDESAFTAHTADTTIHHTSTSAVTSGSTSVITSGGVYQQMGGMKIVKLTQSAYDALSPNYDSNTIYFIVN